MVRRVVKPEQQRICSCSSSSALVRSGGSRTSIGRVLTRVLVWYDRRITPSPISTFWCYLAEDKSFWWRESKPSSRTVQKYARERQNSSELAHYCCPRNAVWNALVEQFSRLAPIRDKRRKPNPMSGRQRSSVRPNVLQNGVSYSTRISCAVLCCPGIRGREGVTIGRKEGMMIKLRGGVP